MAKIVIELQHEALKSDFDIMCLGRLISLQEN